jgi:hypothetical protein
VPNSPWVFSGSDTTTQGIPKFRGEDNEQVFTEMCGLTPEQVTSLTEAGVLSIRLPREK